MMRRQQNDRSALTLLALVDLRPSGAWDQLRRPHMGITPIMDYAREHYGREYAPNTRETFRRQTMHQFVEAGIAQYNPDDPARPVNSPNACYQVSEEALRVIVAYGTPAWDAAVERWLEIGTPLAAKWGGDREMRMIPVKVAKRREVALTPGAHSELLRDILKSFAPRFAPGAEDATCSSSSSLTRRVAASNCPSSFPASSSSIAALTSSSDSALLKVRKTGSLPMARMKSDSGSLLMIPLPS